MSTLAIYDASDGPVRSITAADVLLAVGPVDSSPTSLFDSSGAARTKAVFLRERCITGTVESMARSVGVALVAVRSDMPWSELHTDISRIMSGWSSVEATSTDDLNDLVEALATTTGGIAAIEDENCRNLAYSSNSQHADALWKKNVLRRVAPGRNFELIQEWGIRDELQNSNRVIEVPADPIAGRRRRLAAPMHSSGSWIGAIWLQEMPESELADDVADILVSTAELASRIVERSKNQWTSLRREMHAALGLSPIDAGIQTSLQARLQASTDKTAILIGIAPLARADMSVYSGPPSENVVAIRAAHLWPSHLTLAVHNRIYIAIPAIEAESRKTTLLKTQKLITTLENNDGILCAAAVGSTVPRFLDLGNVRPAVDRALDILSSNSAVSAATIESLEQQIALRALLEHLNHEPLWSCSKISLLEEYDRKNQTELSGTLRTYLESAGSVAKVAEKTHLHVNTVRYRITRAAEITRADFEDPLDRITCLLDLWRRQLAKAGRSNAQRSLSDLTH